MKYFVILLIFSLYCILANAQESSKQARDIHFICSASPVDCLAAIPPYLDNTPQKSRLWFQYKLYELNALFQLARYDLLRKKVTPWVDLEGAPLKFKINTYIFYAKTLRASGNTELSDKYLTSAIDELNSITKESADPMLMVQIANAFNEQKKYQKGYDLLIELERKHRHRDDPVLKVELYGNLGHFTQKLGKLEQHIVYREEVLKWSLRHPDQLRVVIAEYNLARAHQEVTNYERAIELFKQSRNTALEKGNLYVAEMAVFRQAQIAFQQKKTEAAIELMKSVDYSKIPETLMSTLNKFNSQLGIKLP